MVNYSLDFKKDYDSKIIDVYTDGSYSNQAQVGAWAIWSKDFTDSGVLPYRSSSGYCEMYAVYEALVYTRFGYDMVNIHTDSTYVISHCERKIYEYAKNDWKPNGSRKSIPNEDLLKEVYDMLKDMNVMFYKVKSHKNKHNILVDRLANRKQREWIYWNKK